jgi:hypothetical protein
MEIQKANDETTDLVPYERGISLREVAKGTLARFLPGSFIGLGVLQVLLPLRVPYGPLALAELLLLEVGALVIGFGLGLVGLHRWLYPDSEVAARKTFVAGLLSPMALIIAGTLNRILQVDFALVFLLVGVVMALGMYFPWLSPTPEGKRSDRYEPDQPEQLPDGARDAT